MDTFLEILKYTIPALIVVLSTYLVINRLFTENEKQRRYEFLRTATQQIIPARLQAYERLTLFLERMVPDNLVMRQPCASLSVVQLQTKLLEAIRNEFDHNISQQLYVGNDVWIMVRNAKESMMQLVNSCAAQMSEGATGITLAQAIIETYNSVDETAIDAAQRLLKSDLIERLG